ncbi:MAG: hypothetical protein ACRC5N_04890, partial [Plesiomonas sp.]
GLNTESPPVEDKISPCSLIIAISVEDDGVAEICSEDVCTALASGESTNGNIVKYLTKNSVEKKSTTPSTSNNSVNRCNKALNNVVITVHPIKLFKRYKLILYFSLNVFHSTPH